MIQLNVRVTASIRLSKDYTIAATDEMGYRTINVAHKAPDKYELRTTIGIIPMDRIKVLYKAEALPLSTWNRVKQPDWLSFQNQQPIRRFRYTNRTGKNYTKGLLVGQPYATEIIGDYGNVYIPGGDYHYDSDQYKDVLLQLDNPEYIFILNI